jgi:phosphoribosylformylglycinamidine cyclo-ligase
MEATGHDLVATVADDLCAMGARPAAVSCFVSHDLSGQGDAVTDSVVEACAIAECAFIGVQTEPDASSDKSSIMMGTAVGFAPAEILRIRAEMRPGDAVIGMLSNGLRTSGFDLIAAHLFGEESGRDVPEGEVIDIVTQRSTIYTPAAMAVLELAVAHGLVNVSRLGLSASLGPALSEGVSAHLDRGAWEVPQVFQSLQDRLALSDETMFQKFNMGIGFVVIAPAEYAEPILAVISEYDRSARIMGEIVPGMRSVRID